MRADEASQQIEVGGRPTVGQDEPADTPVDELGRRARRGSAATDRFHGNAASRSGRGSRPDRQPVAGDREARRRAAPARRRRDMARTTRVAPAAKASRIASAPSSPPATWIGTATRRGDRPTASRLRRRAGPRAVEVDEVDDPGALRRRTARRSARADRSGAPTPADGARPGHDPRAAALEVDGRDHLHGAAVSARRSRSAPDRRRRDRGRAALPARAAADGS